MDGEISTKDLYNLIQGLITKCDAIQAQNTEIKEELKQEIRTNKTDISSELNKIKQENEDLKIENNNLKKRVSAVERKFKKYNLVFYGLEEKNTENEDIEHFLEIVNNKLEANCNISNLKDIHRIGKHIEGKKRPVLVEFNNYKLKVDLLKNSKKLKGTGIYLALDYIPEDYEKQKFLRSYLKEARENQCEATIRNNVLYVNGEKFTYEDLKERESKEQVRSEEKGEGEVGSETEEEEENIPDTGTQTQAGSSHQNKISSDNNANSANKKEREPVTGTKRKQLYQEEIKPKRSARINSNKT